MKGSWPGKVTAGNLPPRRCRRSSEPAGRPTWKKIRASAIRALLIVAILASAGLAVYAERWAPAPIGPVCVYLHGVGL